MNWRFDIVNLSRKAYRGSVPKPDKKGYRRPEVGGRRFNVGHKNEVSEGEASRRITAIRDLFDRQCQHHGIDFWARYLIPWAVKLASGESLVYPVSSYARNNNGQAAEEAIIIERLRSLGLDVRPDDTDTISIGEEKLKTFIDDRIRREVAKTICAVKHDFGLPVQLQQRLAVYGPPNSAAAETKTFHQALRAYREFVQRTGKKNEQGKLAPSPNNYCKWSLALEKNLDDWAFWEIDRNKIEEMFAHWRNRPVSTATGENISTDYANHLMGCLWAVLVWVDESADWAWELPKGASRIGRTANTLDVDRKKLQTRRVSGSIYTPAELATISENVDRLGKLILGLSVNCAMQPAEAGRVEILDFFSKHPETGEIADWIIFDRPKTFEYGEWVLWPEVAELVRWGMERAKKLDATRLIVDDEGRPWYREQSSKPEGKFSKWFQAKPTKLSRHIGVVTRLKRDVEGFPRHTIKTLRKILPNLVRPKYGVEIADLVNARKVDKSGRVGGRETDRYADRLYDNVAEAIRSLEQQFRPFLDTLKD